MRLRGKMHHNLDAIHRALDRRRVSDVAMDKDVMISIKASDVLSVASVGKRVEVGDFVVRMIGEPIPNKVRSDESGASGYEQVHMSAFFIKIDGLSKHDTVTVDLWPK